MKNVTKAGGKQEMTGKGDRDGGFAPGPIPAPSTAHFFPAAGAGLAMGSLAPRRTPGTSE